MQREATVVPEDKVFTPLCVSLGSSLLTSSIPSKDEAQNYAYKTFTSQGNHIWASAPVQYAGGCGN